MVRDKDVVPTMPKLCGMFKHTGREVLVDAIGNWIPYPLYVGE